MFSDPQKNIEQFQLLPGMKVADLGSGSGFYCLEAARVVTDSGRVYAIDIQKDLLDRLKRTAQKEGIYNIEVIWGDAEKPGGSKLANNLLDAVFITNLLFQIEDKKNAVNEARRILKPGGRVLVVDWNDSHGGLGPRPENVVSLGSAKKMFEEAGFKFDREIKAGVHHYGFIAQKS